MTEFSFDLQLFGGHGGGSSSAAEDIKSSAAGATNVTTGAENLTAATKSKFKNAMNRRATDKTGNTVEANDALASLRKTLLGE